MKVQIKKIIIKRFRSFGQVEIDAARLNIYSGKNNAGKSNILRTLNLFFNSQSNYGIPYNHQADYNKAFRGAAGGKREVQIEVVFAGTGDGALKDDFSICRFFSEGSTIPETRYKSTNDKVEAEIERRNGNITRQFTAFLNKIEYLYIPAVRDKTFVRSLLLRFEQVIKSAAKGEEFSDTINELSRILGETSKGISESFRKYMQMPATASLSSDITDVLGAIEIDVDSGIQVQDKKMSDGARRVRNIPISLFSSGDGIVMAYLVYFLAFLTKNDKKNFIWGFEEPENSLEYSKVEELASQFYEEFSRQAQIFITTHSPAFINLRKYSDVLLYRVYIEPQSPSDRERGLPNKQLSRVEKLDAILRQLSFLAPDDPRYDVLDYELHLAEQSTELENLARSIREERGKLIQERKKFEEQNSHVLKNFPEKIFICEDELGVEVWRHLLAEVGVTDVEIMTSGGCSSEQIENWTRIQSVRKPGYHPKVFREIDRDGMLAAQIEVVRNTFASKYDKYFKYSIEPLPVNEIENFAILNDYQAYLPEKYDEIPSAQLLNIDRHFTRTSSTKIAQMLKFTNNKEEFPSSTTEANSKVEEMRNCAMSEYRKNMPGKELAKLIPNFKPDKFLKNLGLRDFPEELKSYLENIKSFFSKEG